MTDQAFALPATPPTMFERFPIAGWTDARFLAWQLGCLAMTAKRGLDDLAVYALGRGGFGNVESPGPGGRDFAFGCSQASGWAEIALLVSYIGTNTGLLDLDGPSSLPLHEAGQDGILPVRVDGGEPLGFADATQFWFPVVNVLGAIALSNESLKALSESTGQVRTAAVTALAALWQQASRKPL